LCKTEFKFEPSDLKSTDEIGYSVKLSVTSTTVNLNPRKSTNLKKLSSIQYNTSTMITIHLSYNTLWSLRTEAAI